jgi:hypothetical protein
MGQTLLIRVRELVSSGVFMGRIDVFSGGLEVEESVILSIRLEVNLH